VEKQRKPARCRESQQCELGLQGESLKAVEGFGCTDLHAPIADSWNLAALLGFGVCFGQDNIDDNTSRMRILEAFL
jgi:hypothetical protein